MCWKSRLSDVVPKLKANYEVGMQAGDVEFATNSLMAFTFLSTMCGHHLGTIVKEMTMAVQIEMQYNLGSSEYVFRPHLKTLLELTGDLEASDWTKEFSRHLDEKKAKTTVATSQYVLLLLYLRRAHNALIMGEPEKADRARQVIEFCRKEDTLFGTRVLSAWVCCLSSVQMLNCTGRRKYEKNAKKEIRWFEQVAKSHGAINIAHMYVQLKMVTPCLQSVTSSLSLPGSSSYGPHFTPYPTRSSRLSQNRCLTRQLRPQFALGFIPMLPTPVNSVASCSPNETISDGQGSICTARWCGILNGVPMRKSGRCERDGEESKVRIVVDLRQETKLRILMLILLP